MKLSINVQSANALRDLSESLPFSVQNIVDSTLKLISTYQAVSDTLGVHRQAFYDLLLHIKKMQEQSGEAIEVLAPLMRKTADKIFLYLQMHPEVGHESTDNADRIITGTTVGADGELHNHQTFITYSDNLTSGVHSTGFENHEQAKEWGQKFFAKWQKGLSNQLQNAIVNYSGAGYDRLNRNLRAGVPLESEDAVFSASLHNALKQASVPNDITVYRALSENAIRELALYCCQGNICEGSSFTDPGFLSCSLIRDNQFNRSTSNKYILKLTAVAGIHAAYIGDISLFDSEEELLVDSNHSVYITGVTECLRNVITNREEDDDTVTLIEGIITI